MKKRYPETAFAWTTDVNAAAYGELRQGAAQGKDSCVYLTVGTGIGAGVVREGKIFEGSVIQKSVIPMSNATVKIRMLAPARITATVWKD